VRERVKGREEGFFLSQLTDEEGEKKKGKQKKENKKVHTKCTTNQGILYNKF
jgi:hypothetical protein